MELQGWRDLALVFLLIQVLVVGIAAGAVVFFALRGVRKVDEAIRGFLPQVHEEMDRVALSSATLGHSVTDPLIELQSRVAQVKGVVRALWPGNGRHT